MRAVFENKNLCIDVIGSFLNSKELGRLLCTCKKLYSFSPAHFTTIRDCWWQFGDPVFGHIGGWLEYCTRANDTQALNFLAIDEVYPRYLEFQRQEFRVALHNILSGIVSYVAKYGTIKTLQWAIGNHGRLMDRIDAIGLHHQFTAFKLQITLKASILDASDESALYLLQSYEDAMLSERPDSFFEQLFFRNVLDRGRCEALFKYARSKSEPRPGLLYEVLSTAESPRYIDFLCEQEDVVYAGSCLASALENPNNAIFDYVMRKFPISKFETHYAIYKAHYENCKSELQIAIVKLQQGGNESKNWIEAIGRIQERIASMELYYARYFYGKWPRMIPESPDCYRWVKRLKN